MKKGDTINFKRSGSITEGTILIGFRQPHFFSTEMLLDESSVSVVQPVTRTTFHCTLFVGGLPRAQSKEDDSDGGAIDPAGT